MYSCFASLDCRATALHCPGRALEATATSALQYTVSTVVTEVDWIQGVDVVVGSASGYRVKGGKASNARFLISCVWSYAVSAKDMSHFLRRQILAIPIEIDRTANIV